MAEVAGTVQGIQLIEAGPTGHGARKTYLCTFSFGTYTASADTAQVTGLDTAIQNQTRNGKTFTIRGAMGAHPGYTSDGDPVYASAAITAGTTAGQLDFDLGGVTAEADAAASDGVGIFVMGDES